MNRYTPVRIALPLCLGIIFMVSPPGNHSWLFLSLACLSWLILLLVNILAADSYGYRWLPGVVATTSLFLTGMAIAWGAAYGALVFEDSMSGIAPDAVKIIRLDEKPVARKKVFSGMATLTGYFDGSGDCLKTAIRVQAYFASDSLAGRLTAGDLVLTRCELQEIDGPKNPGAFDYQKYLANQHIRKQLYLAAGDWEVIDSYHIQGLSRWSSICREQFSAILRRFGIEGKELGLASALILGSREMLDRQMMQEFSNAGAIHVLSVSGLHVGIMYVLADRLLFFMKRSKPGRKLQLVLIILSIWAYAFLTGMPPSVTRASMMFSLIAAGKMLNRSHDSFNILAGALIIQLWISPYEITQAGFQLSYLAVLGIFAFYNGLNTLLADSRRVIAWTWSILAVSIAAQLATFPVATYYFRFFPVYFLLTNLVVVPLAGIVVYLALVVLLAGAAGISCSYIGLPLLWSLRLMHESVTFIQSWPGAVIKPLNLNIFQVLLIYLSIIGLFLYFKSRYRAGIWITLVPLVFIILLAGWERYRKNSVAEIDVYCISGHTAVDFISNRQSVFLGDSALFSMPEKINSQVIPGRLLKGISGSLDLMMEEKPCMELPGLMMHYPFIAAGRVTMVVIDQGWHPGNRHENFEADLALVCGRNRLAPDKILPGLMVSQVVVSGSVPPYIADRWVEACKQKGLPCHVVLQAGAFVKTL